jgi:Mg-chelatase subunit ChlD
MAQGAVPLPVVLPDCTARRTAHALSATQRRAIIRILASEGAKGLEKWLREEERRDPHIRKRLAEERERLERDARRRQRELEESQKQRRKRAESQWERSMRQYTEREDELKGRIDQARAGPRLRMEDLVRSSSLFAAVAGEREKVGLLQRIGGFFLSIWAFIVGLWVRMVRLIKRLFGWKPPQPKVFTLPDGTELPLSGKTGLDPRMITQVRRYVKQDRSFKARMKSMWDRLLGREDYAETAMRLMQQELEERKHKRALELEAEADELEARLKQIEKESRRQARRRSEEIEEIDKQEERELEELQEHLRRGPYEQMREEVLEELEEAGLVDQQGDPTEALLERFSTLLFDEARRTLPSGGETTPGSYMGGEGEYHKAPLQSQNERGAIELVDSVIKARLNHPHIRHLYDSDLMVHREVRTARTHVVLIFDQSGSMEEKGRLQAAKTVCLTMYRAIKEIDPLNRVDILAMSTGVRPVNLAGLWNAEPQGFTNHGRALLEARILLEEEGADRRLVYLITDGLPEARTVKGIDSADRPEVCMPYALENARELGAIEGTRLMVIQLETEDPLYLEAAREIARAADGHVEAVEPEKLSETLLVDLERIKQREDSLKEVI